MKERKVTRLPEKHWRRLHDCSVPSCLSAPEFLVETPRNLRPDRPDDRGSAEVQCRYVCEKHLPKK